VWAYVAIYDGNHNGAQAGFSYHLNDYHCSAIWPPTSQSTTAAPNAVDVK
jgi:hypothetical protein